MTAPQHTLSFDPHRARGLAAEVLQGAQTYQTTEPHLDSSPATANFITAAVQAVHRLNDRTRSLAKTVDAHAHQSLDIIAAAQQCDADNAAALSNLEHAIGRQP